MPTITRRNKVSTARETVYDRCAYIGCFNGKFINGRKLFHFPGETDKRLEMWIERSGNFRLRTWAATSLRKAGLCGDHFDDEAFTNASRKMLRRNVVPRHYTEDLKVKVENQENRNSEIDVFDQASVKGNQDDPLESIKTCTFIAEPWRGCEIHQEFGSSQLMKVESRSRSPSPMVEFIVEELDETLLQGMSNPLSSSNVQNEGVSGKVEDRTNKWSTGKTKTDKNTSTKNLRNTDQILNITFDARQSNLPKATSDEEEPNEETYDSEENIILPNTYCSYTSTAESKILTRLRNENKQLRRALRSKQNCRCSNVQEAENPRPKDVSGKHVDEFLDAQGCTSFVARALVKLVLHKPKTPYTMEERAFATGLYRKSSATFVDLKKFGCNFPGSNTVKRWLAEYELEERYLMNDGGQPTTIASIDNIEHRIPSVTQIIDSEEVAIDALVPEHMEVQTGAEEYVEASTTDGHSEDVFP